MTADSKENNEWTKVSGQDVYVQVLESTKGPDARPVEKGTAILLNLQGWYLQDKEDFESQTPTITSQSSRLFQDFEGWLVVVGAGDFIQGLDAGLASLREGQTAYVYCAAALGTRKYKECQVPANANVVYKVTITTIVQDTSRLNPYFTIQKAVARKKIANDLYQCECFDTKNKQARKHALDLYRTVGRDMKDLLGGTYFASVEPNHPQRAECQHIMMDCYNNVVVLYMQTKEYTAALEAVDLALQRTSSFSSNLKALVRRAKICVHLATSTQKLQRAQQAIETAHAALGFSNSTEEAELEKIKALYQKREAQINQT